MEFATQFDARLGEGDVTLTERDVRLLRRIDECGSINAAAGDLGRSYARAQERVVDLGDAFGDLVERTRGGAGGGGSRLTERARTLISQYERLCLEFEGLAETRETVLPGQVLEREGELATVETGAGVVTAVVPTAGEGDRGTAEGGDVQVAVRADAVTLHDPDDSPAAGETSARNRLEGTVVAVDASEAVAAVAVDVGGPATLWAIVTVDSVERLSLSAGTTVVASFKATATRGIATE